MNSNSLSIYAGNSKVKKILSLSVVLLLLVLMLFKGCTRIETGEVGLRLGFDKQISPGELMPGSFNQTLIGSVLTFPVKDVSVLLDDMTPLAKDNSTMKDFDASVFYSINPTQVSEIYSTKNRTFHLEAKGDVLLMYHYIGQLARNAIYKSSRKYEALDMTDNRNAMEQEVKEIINHALTEEKLNGALTISQVLIRNIKPSDTVVNSANELVRAKNELRQKEIEVKTAEAESRRMAALANQSAQSIHYMQAQAMLNISEGVKTGKVQTIVVPHDFKGLVNVK
jgi:regulator of protease activity HflC (stomatin/prohibitin superfamily)